MWKVLIIIWIIRKSSKNLWNFTLRGVISRNLQYSILTKILVHSSKAAQDNAGHYVLMVPALGQEDNEFRDNLEYYSEYQAICVLQSEIVSSQNNKNISTGLTSLTLETLPVYNEVSSAVFCLPCPCSAEAYILLTYSYIVFYCAGVWLAVKSHVKFLLSGIILVLKKSFSLLGCLTVKLSIKLVIKLEF